MDDFISLIHSHKNNDNKTYACLINKQLQQYFNVFDFDKFLTLYKINKFSLQLTINYDKLRDSCSGDKLYTNIELMKLLIDNYENITVKNNKSNVFKLIHIISRNCKTFEIIKYAFDKGFDLNCNNNLNYTPFHYICKYSTEETIKYIIDNYMEIWPTLPLNCGKNKNNSRPINLICEYQKPEMIKYFICKFKDLNLNNILESLNKNKNNVYKSHLRVSKTKDD
jgi:ankyrin repeat protein